MTDAREFSAPGMYNEVISPLRSPINIGAHCRCLSISSHRLAYLTRLLYSLQTLRSLVVVTVLIIYCKSVPDVAVRCDDGFFFNHSDQRCTECSESCPRWTPLLQCECSAYSDQICAPCPIDTRYNSDLDTCLPVGLVDCPMRTSTRCKDNTICLRNETLSQDFCVCSSAATGCDFVVSVVVSDGVCFSSQRQVNFETPQSDLLRIREDDTKLETDAALIGFIVAICCIGLVVISVFVILVIGIACHNRLIMWQHRRDLHRLRRERRHREARRRAETERRQLNGDQEGSGDEPEAEVSTGQEQADNSAVHGSDGRVATREETADEGGSDNEDHTD